MVLVDSGLRTVEPLDFRASGVLDAEPDDVAEFPVRNASLPSLSGRHLRLVGIGDTSSPQTPLPVRRYDNLVAIRCAIAEKAEAACVSVDTAPCQGRSVKRGPGCLPGHRPRRPMPSAAAGAALRSPPPTPRG